jgi:hypothetical protein
MLSKTSRHLPFSKGPPRRKTIGVTRGYPCVILKFEFLKGV